MYSYLEELHPHMASPNTLIVFPDFLPELSLEEKPGLRRKQS
jgi:hypothetical protein